MFETSRQYPLSVLNQAARDPLDIPGALQNIFLIRTECTDIIGYMPDRDWEFAPHRRLGMSSKSVGDGFWPLWSKPE